MSLEQFGIGGIQGIGGFGGINAPKPNTSNIIERPEANKYASTIETTSTPKNDAISSQNMSFAPKIGGIVNASYNNANLSTEITRKIEDLKTKTATPKINPNIGFGGTFGIGKIAGVNAPTIGNDFSNIKGAEQTQATNFTPEVKQKIAEQTKPKMDYVAFGDSIKAKYPEYNDIDSKELGQKMINKYPEYSDIVDTSIKKEDVQGKSLGDRIFGGILGTKDGQTVGEYFNNSDGLIKGTLKGTKEAFTTNIKDFYNNSKAILADTKKDGREKFNQILLGEGVGGLVAGGIGDILGGAIEGAFKGAATESEQKYMSQEVKSFIKDSIEVAKTNPEIQAASSHIKSKRDKLSGEQKQELQTQMGYLLDYANFIGVSEIVPGVIKGTKTIGTIGKDVIKETGEIIAKKELQGVLDSTIGKAVKTLKGEFVEPFAKKAVTNTEKATISTIAKTKPDYADELIENMHGFTTSEIRNYKAKYGETPGKTLNDRGIIAGGEETLTKTLDTMNQYRKQKLAGFEAITSKVPLDDDVIQMAQEVADFERAVLIPSQIKANGGITKYDGLLEKAKKGELSNTELENIKSNFERNKNLPYQKSLNKIPEEAKRLIKLDDSVRTNQQKRAEEAGFTNLKEINQEISKNKAISDLLSKDVDKIGKLSVSDYILLAESTVDPSSLALFATKKAAQSKWFKEGLIKAVNKINGRKTIEEKIIDFKVIQNINSEAEWNNFIKGGQLQNPALPNLGNIGENPATIIAPGKKIISTSQGNIIEGNISELPNKVNIEQNIANMKIRKEGLSNLGKINNQTMLSDNIYKSYLNKGLTSKEIKAINDYVISPEFNLDSKNVSNGLKKLDNYEGIVYRGDEQAYIIGNKKIGDTIITNRLISTEIKKNYYNSEKIKYEIKSKEGKDLGKLNNNNEVLFDKGTKFKIDNIIENKDGTKIIKLSEI